MTLKRNFSRCHRLGPLAFLPAAYILFVVSLLNITSCANAQEGNPGGAFGELYALTIPALGVGHPVQPHLVRVTRGERFPALRRVFPALYYGGFSTASDLAKGRMSSGLLLDIDGDHAEIWGLVVDENGMGYFEVMLEAKWEGPTTAKGMRLHIPTLTSVGALATTRANGPCRGLHHRLCMKRW